MHLEILNSKQKEILKQLAFTKKLDMYLAGGTALALQIGHRTSVDFDFYTSKYFKKGSLIKHFKDNLGKYSLKVLRDTDDTFEIQVNDILISCFFYFYSLIENLENIQDVQLASIKDIAAMKIVAISQRGKRRDFIDIYYLIEELGLEAILLLTEKKYPEFDRYNGLRGLVYFIDADKDKEVSRVKTFKDISWVEMKKYLEEKIRQLQKKHD